MPSYTINLTEKAHEELKQAVSILKLESEEAAIRKALGLLHFVAKEIYEGGKLVVENKRLNLRREVNRV